MCINQRAQAEEKISTKTIFITIVSFLCVCATELKRHRTKHFVNTQSLVREYFVRLTKKRTLRPSHQKKTLLHPLLHMMYHILHFLICTPLLKHMPTIKSSLPQHKQNACTRPKCHAQHTPSHVPSLTSSHKAAKSSHDSPISSNGLSSTQSLPTP